MNLIHEAAIEVAMRLRDLDNTKGERRTEEETVCNLLIDAVAPAIPAISTRVEFVDGSELHGVPVAERETIDCGGLLSGWGLYLTDAGLCFVTYGPEREDFFLAYCSTREALESRAITALELAQTLAGILDAHLHGKAEVRRREYAEILGRMRAASAALRGEG